jgi:hypothetical protein
MHTVLNTAFCKSLAPEAGGGFAQCAPPCNVHRRLQDAVRPDPAAAGH